MNLVPWSSSLVDLSVLSTQQLRKLLRRNSLPENINTVYEDFLWEKKIVYTTTAVCDEYSPEH